MNSAPPTLPPAVHPAATVAPTLGSLIGSAAGLALAAVLHIPDPVNAGLVVSAVTGVVTAVFHWLGNKIGVNLG
jgi:hypothetical protein